LIFEDSPTGAKAAANGNAQSIILNTTHTQDEFAQIEQIKHFMLDYRDLKLNKEADGKFYLHV